jgi:hypothetical protein
MLVLRCGVKARWVTGRRPAARPGQGVEIAVGLEVGNLDAGELHRSLALCDLSSLAETRMDSLK